MDDGRRLAPPGSIPPPDERVIPASRRPDGTLRKEIRVRAGYVAQEDVATYPKGSGPELPPGMDPELAAEMQKKKAAAAKKKKKAQGAGGGVSSAAGASNRRSSLVLSLEQSKGALSLAFLA
ncbi:unnamed protein product [Closterium sp. Naga37s-1]|nr:unnamed protein product [Closterium sp. Naga37s-1]